MQLFSYHHLNFRLGSLLLLSAILSPPAAGDNTFTLTKIGCSSSIFTGSAIVSEGPISNMSANCIEVGGLYYLNSFAGGTGANAVSVAGAYGINSAYATFLQGLTGTGLNFGVVPGTPSGTSYVWEAVFPTYDGAQFGEATVGQSGPMTITNQYDANFNLLDSTNHFMFGSWSSGTFSATQGQQTGYNGSAYFNTDGAGVYSDPTGGPALAAATTVFAPAVAPNIADLENRVELYGLNGIETSGTQSGPIQITSSAGASPVFLSNPYTGTSSTVPSSSSPA